MVIGTLSHDRRSEQTLTRLSSRPSGEVTRDLECPFGAQLMKDIGVPPSLREVLLLFYQKGVMGAA